ncbi:MAG: hypothetical protein KF712_16110 [Akkermansiaceae bacterium]|nr:hypothetical protein [Akkermansiaceae bacterium]
MNFSKPLSDTLTQFNAAALADGNLPAGINILAAMCCTLCGILPRGAGFRAPGGDILPVGLDFLMLDGLSSSLTDAKVFRQMADMQSALTANVAKGNTYEAHHGIGMTMHGTPIYAAPSNDNAMTNLESTLNGFGSRSGDSSPFEALLFPTSEAMKSDLKTNSMVFARLDSNSPPFEKYPSTHLSQPFIRAFLDTGTGQRRFLQQLKSLAQCGVGGLALHSRIALSATPTVFRDLLTNGAADFLMKSLWIYDHPRSAPQQNPIPNSSYSITQAFDAALRKAWSQRLDHRLQTPPAIICEWRKNQGVWVSYLAKQENRFPGISATAYTLFSTLLFGLCRLSNKETGSASPAGAFDMAKHLIERMIALREHLVQSEERSRLRTIAIRLLPKLDGRPYTARDLVRKSNRLPIDDCRRALQLLSQERIVVRVGEEQWKLALPVEDGLQKIRTSIIEV